MSESLKTSSKEAKDHMYYEGRTFQEMCRVSAASAVIPYTGNSCWFRSLDM